MSLLKDINLTEEQQKEFTAKLDSWKEEQTKAVKESLEKEYANKSRITEDGDLDLTEEEAKIFKDKLLAYKEKVLEEAEEKIGDNFYKVFKQGEAKLKKEYSDKFVKTVKEMYEEIETKVREKLMETSEFKAFNEIKKNIAPFIVEGEYKDTVLEDTKELKKVIKEQSEKLEAIKIKSKLDQLTEGMPANIKEQFISTLGPVKTENELIEAFQKNIKLVKQVKEQIINELNESAKVTEKEEAKKVTPPSEPTKEVKSEEIELTPRKVITEETAPEKKQVKKEEPQKRFSKPAVEDFGAESKVDYDILSENFKREEKKPEHLQRLRQLAGLD
jgi:hypothetical protein